MPKSLTDAAQEVIDLFNNPGSDYGQLLKKMEYNVVLKRVLYPDSVHGIGDVTGYLNNYMFDRNPGLVDSNGSRWKGTLTPMPPDSHDATSGEVSGNEYYLDDNGKTLTPIAFSLSFVRKSADAEWSLINSFATPTDLTKTITV
jgi:hypothetical protein